MRSALVLLAVLLVATLAVPAVASPQPDPICDFCGSEFERAADRTGVDVDVERSTAVVQVHENGSATWTVRNRVSNGSRSLRGSPDLLERIGRDLVDGNGPVRDPTFASARMEGDVAVLTYRDPDAAERHAGVLVVEYLWGTYYDPWYKVNVDRLTMRGPPGTVVSNDPEGPRIDGRTATWEGDGGGELWDAPDVEENPYVVFAPAASGTGGVRTELALALATLPVVVGNAVAFLVLQTVAFAGVVTLGIDSVQRTWWEDPRGPALLIGVLGVGGGLVSAAAGVWELPGIGVFAAGMALLATTGEIRERLGSPRRQAVAVGGVLAGTVWATLGVQALLGGEPSLAAALRSTALALPFAALVPVGAVVAVEPHRRMRWLGAAALTFAAVPPSLLAFGAPQDWAFFLGIGFGIVAVLYGGVGLLFVLFGRSLASDPPEPEGQPWPPRTCEPP